VSVCLIVCLSVRWYISKATRPNFTKFKYILPLAVARYSSDGNAIFYVFPVLWMTSFPDNGENRPESKTTHIFRPVLQMVAPGEKSAVSDCILI